VFERFIGVFGAGVGCCGGIGAGEDIRFHAEQNRGLTENTVQLEAGIISALSSDSQLFHGNVENYPSAAKLGTVTFQISSGRDLSSGAIDSLVAAIVPEKCYATGYSRR
jgi:hypothetical protein